MIEPAGNMIAMFDYIVNGTQYLKAGCYISQDSFKEMEKISAELMMLQSSRRGKYEDHS